MCLVNNFDTPTPIETDLGNVTVTIHEREPRAYGAGLATLKTCAILAALIQAQELSVETGTSYSTSEFCKECGSLVKLTIVPSKYFLK